MMNELQLPCAACFQPVLLSTTYNEDQIKYLVQKAIEIAIVLCVYVVIDDPNKQRKIYHVGLSPQQVRYVWQNQLEITELVVTTDDGSIVKTTVNILGLMVDKSGADFYLKAASEGIDPSDMRHISNIPSLKALTKFTVPNKYNINLAWKEIAALKGEISQESPDSRKTRIKQRVIRYMQILANEKPHKKDIIQIVHAQENTIRKDLGIPEEKWPSLKTYERDERENRR